MFLNGAYAVDRHPQPHNGWARIPNNPDWGFPQEQSERLLVPTRFTGHAVEATAMAQNCFILDLQSSW
jgi:hypothetical protein